MIQVALLALAAAGAGQGAQDARWLPYEGCWVAEAAGVGEAAGPLLCIARRGPEVVFSTWLDGELASEQVLRADGVARAVEEGGCSGTEVAQWSADGRRVFVRQALECPTAPRASTAVLAFVSGGAFVDVRAVRVGTERQVRSIRYRALPPAEYPEAFGMAAGDELARETARLHAAAALDAAAVVEASRLVETDAVNGLLAARRAGFALNASALRQLRTAGVDASTIDVMVALTYPDRFAVAEERQVPPRQWATAGRGYEGDRYDPYDRYLFGYDNFYYDRLMACRAYGYLSSYSCFGYSPYQDRYGYGGTWVYPVTPGGGSGEAGQPGARGSVARDGYRRGGNPSRGTAAPRGSSSGSYVGTGERSSTASSGSGSGSSGSGTGAASAGSSGHSGGSGTQSKGTAKPRGGGEKQ